MISTDFKELEYMMIDRTDKEQISDAATKEIQMLSELKQVNNRIKVLEDQCWEDCPVVFNKEKFVQLIVKECVDAIKSNRWAKDHSMWATAMLYSADIVYGHFFGIKQ